MSSAPVLGLIGGIGSGKSRVAAALAWCGALVLSGDEAGHEALRQPEIRQQIVQRWGQEILDVQGEIVRRRLGVKVFASPTQRVALESMVHPWIKQRLQEGIDAAKQNPKVNLIVLDAAILLEAGWHAMCAAIVFVETPRAVRLKRLAEQRGWTAEDLDVRERAQLPLEEKARRAHYHVENSGTPEDLERQLDALLQRLGLPGK